MATDESRLITAHHMEGSLYKRVKGVLSPRHGGFAVAAVAELTAQLPLHTLAWLLQERLPIRSDVDAYEFLVLLAAELTKTAAGVTDAAAGVLTTMHARCGTPAELNCFAKGFLNELCWCKNLRNEHEPEDSNPMMQPPVPPTLEAWFQRAFADKPRDEYHECLQALLLRMARSHGVVMLLAVFASHKFECLAHAAVAADVILGVGGCKPGMPYADTPIRIEYFRVWLQLLSSLPQHSRRLHGGGFLHVLKPHHVFAALTTSCTHEEVQRIIACAVAEASRLQHAHQRRQYASAVLQASRASCTSNIKADELVQAVCATMKTGNGETVAAAAAFLEAVFQSMALTGVMHIAYVKEFLHEVVNHGLHTTFTPNKWLASAFNNPDILEGIGCVMSERGLESALNYETTMYDAWTASPPSLRAAMRGCLARLWEVYEVNMYDGKRPAELFLAYLMGTRLHHAVENAECLMQHVLEALALRKEGATCGKGVFFEKLMEFLAREAYHWLRKPPTKLCIWFAQAAFAGYLQHASQPFENADPDGLQILHRLFAEPAFHIPQATRSAVIAAHGTTGTTKTAAPEKGDRQRKRQHGVAGLSAVDNFFLQVDAMKELLLCSGKRQRVEDENAAE